jgi:hypothetical protein
MEARGTRASGAGSSKKHAGRSGRASSSRVVTAISRSSRIKAFRRSISYSQGGRSTRLRCGHQLFPALAEQSRQAGMRYATRFNVGKGRDRYSGEIAVCDAPMALSVPPDPRLMTSMPSAHTAAHSGIRPEHLVARATAERKFVRDVLKWLALQRPISIHGS